MPFTLFSSKKFDSLESKTPLDSHFQPFKKISSQFENNENLFSRHLAIYLLDKYFRGINLYKKRHIPLPLEVTYKDDKPIGITSEYVYGFEISAFYYEHLDWDNVNKAFKSFGFQMDSDLYSGFEGEADSLSHNFFCQNSLFPKEKQCVFKAPDSLPWLEHRYSTDNWMRIDFEDSSFPLNKENFVTQFEKESIQLKTTLSEEEYYFLSQYCQVIAGKAIIIDKKILSQCIQQNISEVVNLQQAIKKNTSDLPDCKSMKKTC